MTRDIPQRPVSDGWISQKKTLLACTAAGPAREELADELAEAEERNKAWAAFESAAAKKGYKRNSYRVRCADGSYVEPYEGFAKKNTAGRWVGCTMAQVADAIGW